MKKNMTVENNTKFVIIGVVTALLILPLTLLAQGNGSGNSGDGSGSSDSSPVSMQDKDQQRDQDRTDKPQQDQIRDPQRNQDCLENEDCDPEQDRDEIRLQDPVASDPIQSQDRLRDQDCTVGVDCESDQDRNRQQIYTHDELRTSIQNQQRLMLIEEEGVGDQVQNIYRNQNQVRVAASALASTTDMLGPIGPAVSRIAKDFDNSVQATIQAEEQIQNRSGVTRFFFGSDNDVVSNLDSQVIQNQERVQELNRLIETWDGDVQVKTVLQEQIQNMEQEQIRLQQLVDEEQDSRGLFGFLFGWL
jgi:hypothetical protein